jgi:hypothetical protein
LQEKKLNMDSLWLVFDKSSNILISKIIQHYDPLIVVNILGYGHDLESLIPLNWLI